MTKQSLLDEGMFRLVDYSKGNVICNETSCSIFSAGPQPYRARIPPGIYLFEVWGAAGGDRKGPEGYTAFGGKGGYTSGYTVHTSKEIFLFIGTQGENDDSIGKGGWNGGGSSLYVNTDRFGYIHGGAGGGGATDIALYLGDEYTENRSIKSLKSRIIVAAGGGDAWASNRTQSNYHFINDGGFGGGKEGGGSGLGYTRICNADGCNTSLVTNEAFLSSLTGATQTSSGNNSIDYSQSSQLGGFGYGGNSVLTRNNTGGGGGGGWFGGVGGSGGVNHYGTGGSGGSSYAHTLSDKNEFSSLGNKYIVFNTIFLPGNITTIPNPYEGISESQFDFKNGAVRISFVSPIDINICTFRNHNSHILKSLSYIFIFCFLK